MSANDPDVHEAPARLGGGSRWGEPGRYGRRDFTEERIANYILRVVESAPPLTDEQVRRFSELLRPGR